MKLNRKLAVLAILGMTGLFANGVSNVNTLVNKINTTKDVKERGILLKELDKELSTMDKKELPAAQEIVNSKLKLSKVMEK